VGMKKDFLIQFSLTLIAFILSQLVLSDVLYYIDLSYFDSGNWMRWDSGHYLGISKSGYEFFSCAGKFGYSISAVEMCGNTGWFPGYPLLIRVCSLLFGDSTFIAGIISKLFYFMTLFMVAKIAGMNNFSIRNILLLLISAFSFGFIYYNAIFPISSILFFALVGLYFHLQRKTWISAIFCFLASFFYSTGFLLAIVFAISILFRRNEIFKKRLISIFIIGVFGLLGLASVFLIFQLTVNDWSAFIQVQAKYGHGMRNPISNIQLFFKNNPIFNSFKEENFIQYQTLMVVIGYILLSFYFFIKRFYKNELYLWTYIYISIYFIFPWTVGGNLSMYRAESLLLPFVFLLLETNKLSLSLILICLLTIGIPMSYLFFTSVLI
jgi:hypothetical protein